MATNKTEQHVPEHLSVTPEEIQTIESFLDSIKVPYNKEISLPLRQYLQELVVVLWQEGRDFNPRKPFGKSMWKRDVYEAIVESFGKTEDNAYGTVDNEGFAVKVNYGKCDELIKKMIAYLMC